MASRTQTIKPNEDGSITIPVEPEPGKTYTAEEVAEMVRAAESGEREKLYTKLSTADEKIAAFQQAQEQLTGQVKTLADEREERERLATEAQAAAAEAKRQAELAEMSVAERLQAETQRLQEQMQNRDQEWAKQLASVQQQLQTEQALREREAQYNAVASYRLTALAAAEDIIPELHSFVTGGTPEEIDVSIAAVRETSGSIIRNMQEAMQSHPAPFSPGVRVTQPTAPSLENLTPATEQFTPERIRAMSPQEYAKYRPQLLRAARPGGAPTY